MGSRHSPFLCASRIADERLNMAAMLYFLMMTTLVYFQRRR
jgi:hypothetical protein